MMLSLLIGHPSSLRPSMPPSPLLFPFSSIPRGLWAASTGDSAIKVRSDHIIISPPSSLLFPLLPPPPFFLLPPLSPPPSSLRTNVPRWPRGRRRAIHRNRRVRPSDKGGPALLGRVPGALSPGGQRRTRDGRPDVLDHGEISAWQMLYSGAEQTILHDERKQCKCRTA